MNLTVYLVEQNAYSRNKTIIFFLESRYICIISRDSCKEVFQEHRKAVAVALSRNYFTVSWKRLVAVSCQQPVRKADRMDTEYSSVQPLV